MNIETIIKKVLMEEFINTNDFIYEDIYGSVEDVNLLQEAEYQGRKVQLGKIMQGDIKKFKVYVKNDKGKVVKVNFESYNLGLGSSDQKQYLNISLETSSSTINSINNKSNYYQKKIKFLGPANRDFFHKKEEITITTLDKVMLDKNCATIDLIKIDTEGYEYEVLKGSVEVLKKTKLILFEHHYDNMIIKNYTFKQINNFLIQNSFKKVFKAKMPFRKTFDYIYENTRKF